MFDFGEKWTPAAPVGEWAIDAGAIEVRPRAGIFLYLMSGNLAAGLAELGLDPSPIGATSVAPAVPYALATARDRCLVVSPAPMPNADGWVSAGYATTEMTGGLAAIDLRGPGLSDILSQATTLDWRTPAKSAAISFAGVTAFASFLEHRDAVRIIVETPTVPYLCRWMQAVSR